MSSEILRGERAGDGEPMPWMEVGQGARPNSGGGYQPAHHRSAAGAEPETAAVQAAVERAAREGREAGRREGETAARQASQAEVQRAVADFVTAVRQVAELRPRLRLEAEADLVRLALAIARRVVRRELSIDPEAIGGLVRTALERLRVEEAVGVRMHPQFQEAVRHVLSHTPGAAHIKILPDPTLAVGAIVFETARGHLDASAETQFSEIERGLTDRLQAHGV